MYRSVFYLLAGAASVVATPTLAQQSAGAPYSLLGRWQTSRITFLAQPGTPQAVLDQLDDPEINSLNQAIFLGVAHLIVDFRADSTYTFTIRNGPDTVRVERGSFSLAHNRLLASAPGSPDGSSFHDQQVQRLARRTLVLTFPFHPDLPCVTQQIVYHRMGRYPAIAEAKPTK